MLQDDFVSPSLNGIRKNDYTFEELGGLLDNCQTVDEWKDSLGDGASEQKSRTVKDLSKEGSS